MSFTDKAPKTKIKAGQTYLFQLKADSGTTSDEPRPYKVRSPSSSEALRPSL